MEHIDFDMRILIVDDSHSMLRIVKKFFENKGFYHVFEATNGLEALKMIKNEKDFNLIVSDLNMPRMNGFELLKIVKEDHRTKDIPFVILTVEAIQSTMNQALAMGADSYIVKPVTEKIFMDEIFRVIQDENQPLID